MSVEAIIKYFETIFACKIRLIVQAFHVAVFKCVSNPHHWRLNNYFDLPSLERLFFSLHTCKVTRLFIIVNADGTLRNRVS